MFQHARQAEQGQKHRPFHRRADSRRCNSGNDHQQINVQNMIHPQALQRPGRRGQSPEDVDQRQSEGRQLG